MKIRVFKKRKSTLLKRCFIVLRRFANQRKRACALILRGICGSTAVFSLFYAGRSPRAPSAAPLCCPHIYKPISKNCPPVMAQHALSHTPLFSPHDTREKSTRFFITKRAHKTVQKSCKKHARITASFSAQYSPFDAPKQPIVRHHWSATPLPTIAQAATPCGCFCAIGSPDGRTSGKDEARKGSSTKK